MGGRLDVRGDFLLSYARTNVDVSGGNYVNNPYALAAPAPAVVPAIFFIPATALPTVRSDLLAFTLRAQYALDRQSALGFMYWYQHLHVADYAYDAMQVPGTINTVMPTNQQPPSYSVQVVSASYLYRF